MTDERKAELHALMENFKARQEKAFNDLTSAMTDTAIHFGPRFTVEVIDSTIRAFSELRDKVRLLADKLDELNAKH